MPSNNSRVPFTPRPVPVSQSIHRSTPSSKAANGAARTAGFQGRIEERKKKRRMMMEKTANFSHTFTSGTRTPPVV